MSDDQVGYELVFLLVPAYPGCPGQKPVVCVLFETTRVSQYHKGENKSGFY